MADREAWLELAARCEKATGGSIDLDATFARALGWAHGYIGRERCWYDGGGHMQAQPFRWSRDLSDITALIERELSGRDVHSGTFKGRACGMIMMANGEAGQWIEAATEALARCAAFCRAMAYKGTA